MLGVADVHGKGNFSIIHIDAHTNLRSENSGHYVTIDNMVRLSVGEGIVEGKDMPQVGQRSPGRGPDKLQWIMDYGVRVHFQAEIEHRGFQPVLKDFVADLKAIERRVLMFAKGYPDSG